MTDNKQLMVRLLTTHFGDTASTRRAILDHSRKNSCSIDESIVKLVCEYLAAILGYHDSTITEQETFAQAEKHDQG